ncbi:CidA/LrgA family protein [Gudongella sp. SC589]|jgi:holin-like protein|uniref:CidA/LrgA family protein n=1 Tax=Gudongella sp. SC589 TaxID=3385990 RepID=UPI0039047774
MTALKQLGLILLILWAGQTIQRVFGLSLPGNVLGMLLLLLLLLTGILPLKLVERISDVLLAHLTFLFLPTVVGIITVAHLLGDNLVWLLLILGVSLVVVMVTTGLTVQWLVRRRERKEG